MYQNQQGYAPQGGYAPQQAPQDNLYVGSAKLRQAPFGLVMRLSLNQNDLNKLQEHLNANGWVSLDIKERRAPSPTGSTHYGEIDLWQPQQAQGGYAPQGQYAPQQPQQPPQYRQAPPPQQGYRPAPAQGQYRQAPPPQYRQAPPPQGYRPPQGQPPAPQGQYAPQQPPQGQGYDDGGFQAQGQPPAPAPQPQGQYAQQPPGQPPAEEQHRYGPTDCNLGPEGQLYDADGNPLF